MSDKRQRARVQGSWAKQLPKPSSQTVGIQNNQPNTASGTWRFGDQKTSKTFEFHQPTKPVREIPPERIIEHPGDYEISSGPSGVSQLRLRPGFLSADEADWMFSKLLAELPWSQKTNYRLGEAYEEPRLTCWYGELPYTYARSTMAANPQWHPLLVSLRAAVEQASGFTFNSLLCNLYRDGHDSIGWHSDNEASLGPQPTIASLSLGDTRVFSLRKQPPAEDNGDYTYVERIRIPLSHGTLLLMEGATQDDWQHQVAKEYHDRGPRINLTFRTIHPEPEGHRGPQRATEGHRAGGPQRATEPEGHRGPQSRRATEGHRAGGPQRATEPEGHRGPQSRRATEGHRAGGPQRATAPALSRGLLQSSHRFPSV